MKKLWLILIAGSLLCSLAYGSMDLTPEQQAAVDSVSKQIFLEEQEQFKQVSADAEQGKIDAIYALGVYYISGYGVEIDEEKGYGLVRQAAEQGFADAQNMMGEYSSGTEPDYDYTESLVWWRKAAAQGQPDALFSIGQCYEHGLSVPQNDSTAVYWYRQAAEQGSSDARTTLSFYYQEGVGVAQDYKEALFWMLLEFPDSWDEGYGSIESIAFHLTNEERIEVENRARKWLTEHKK